MQTTPISAIDLFTPTAAVIERTMQPPARGVAVAVTLLELAVQARPDRPFSASLMRHAYLWLASVSRGEDTPAVTARRNTCREIADAIAVAHNLPATQTLTLAGLPIKVTDGVAEGGIVADRAATGGWRAALPEGIDMVLSWWAAAVLLPGDAPRSASIRETGRREMAELEDAILRGVVPIAVKQPPTGERLLALVAQEVEAARKAKAKHAYIDLGVDPIEGGRDGGPSVQAALETLRRASYQVELDGRSGQLVVEVDTGLRPVKSRRELVGNPIERPSPTTEIAAHVYGALAIEALDDFARTLRSPTGDAARDQVKLQRAEAMLVKALEELPGDRVKAPISVIMEACELAHDEGAVLADILIAVKPALARAAGVPTF